MPTYATITLDDRSGYARSNEPVVVSIPLAEADNLTSFSSLAIRQSGSIIPAQFQVISRWGAVGDTAAPIRVLQAIFRVASLSANSRDSSTYTLTDGGTGTATGGITVNNAPTDYIEITTGSTAGAGRFRIRKTAGGGHNVLESGEVHTGSAFKEVLAAGNGSDLYLKGVTTSEDAGARTNAQNAFYRSSTYVTTGVNPLYSVAVESSGPERVVILVTGKWGSTPFKGMNDEANRTAGDESHVTAVDMSYEMRYTFWRDSAYVGLDWLIKAPEGFAHVHDAAIDHGGILVEPNWSGSNMDLFVSAHNDAGTQQGEAITWASDVPRIFQVVGPNGAGYIFSLNKNSTGSKFTLTGATQLREAFMVMQKNAAAAPTNDRYVVLMHRYGKEQSPHGFWYDSSVGCISLWPAEIGEVLTNFNTRSYHIMASQTFYRWEGGLLFGNGLYSASAVRSAWSRTCRSPIIPWCGTKYQTSKAFWYIPPATLTRSGQPDWNEAFQRRVKWGTCMVSAGDSSDGRTIQSTYDDRNNNNYTFYWWSTYGAWAEQGACMSNRYDLTCRAIHAWMITGLPELWEWVERFANHMAFLCTLHGGQTYPSETFGIMMTWVQYKEVSIFEGALHAASANFGLGMEVNHNMYKPLMYMLTGYDPFRYAIQFLVTSKRGFMYNSLFDLSNNSETYYSGLTRRYSFGVEEFLLAFLMQGDTTSLQYARNLAINMLVFSDRTQVGLNDIPPKTTAIATQGGKGSVASLGNSAFLSDQVLFTEVTYTAYAQEAMVMAYDIGTWSRAHGYTQFSTQDLAQLKTFILQSAKYLLVGLDNNSRNLGDTAAQRGSVTSPIIRGHHKTGGNNTIFASPYEWRWATVDLGVDGGGISLTRSTDTGFASLYSGTATISGTAVSVLNPPPTVGFYGSFFYVDGEPQFATRISAHALYAFVGTCTISGSSVTNLSPAGGYSLTPSLVGGWLFVQVDNSAAAVRITAHTSGSTSATLASAYGGTTGSSLTVYVLSTTLTLSSSYGGLTGSRSVTVVGGGVSSGGSLTQEIWAQSVNLFAYAAKLYADDGNPTVSAYILAAVRDLFENIYLYGHASSSTNWDQSFAATTRGNIRLGSTAFSEERYHGWHGRIGSHFYGAYEQALAEVVLPVSVAHYVTF